MSLADKLIDAVAGNCDTANLDRNGATGDILKVLLEEAGRSHHLSNAETGEGVVVNIASYKEPKDGKAFPLTGVPIPPEFDMLFGCGMGNVTGVIRWPHEGGIIRVTYESGFEISFIPAIQADTVTPPPGKPN